MKIPIVTIVGRPNVGKSTLFNNISGRRIAITASESGTTRDRLFHKVNHPLIDFFLVDTGGLEFGKGNSSIEDDMQLQTRVAIDESDLILFVVDSHQPLAAEDFTAAGLLRKKAGNKPIILIANKCDRPLDESELAELYVLGIGEPRQVSALHKTGMDTLLWEITEGLKSKHFITKKDPAYRTLLAEERTYANIALVGKPNVGKSSLINAILNKEKLIVSSTPGTTRDSTDSQIMHGTKKYNFIDTAGLKRPGKSGTGIEKFSALRSMAAIERCDVALLVIDSSEPITHQDQAIANYIVDAGKGLFILANKWDIPNADEDPSDEVIESVRNSEDTPKADDNRWGKATHNVKNSKENARKSKSKKSEKEKRDEASEVEEARRNSYIRKLRYNFSFLPWAPVIFTSAITKKNIGHIFGQVDAILDERLKRITTAKLNQFMQQLIIEHRPTGKGRFNPRIYYITQPEVDPPHFLIFVNKKSAFHFSYIRYIENRLREKFSFAGTPIKLEYREKLLDSRGEPKRR